jgi:hypothetical protein
MPREHGAWGLLLQPFVAGAILSGNCAWLFVPALGLILAGFILREPLVILARQRFVWRTRNPLTTQAVRWLLLELAIFLGCCAWLSRGVPLKALAGFVAGGGLLTLVAVWMTIRNRQRSRTFQMVSAAGLGATAPFAALVCTGGIPSWAWILWAMLTLHGVASILVVHLRLEQRASSRFKPTSDTRIASYAIQSLQIPAGAFLALFDPLLVVPPVFSAVANFLELGRLDSENGLREPLTRVGIRTLTLSLLHMALTIACLWPAAHR